MNTDKKAVLYHEYRESFDLTGTNLFACLDRPREEVGPLLVGGLVPRTSMRTVERPLASLASMTGEVADEVHEWPQVTMGPRFRHLILHFVQGRLAGFRWSFPPADVRQTPRRPWYRRLLG